jgi:hypothetical protein
MPDATPNLHGTAVMNATDEQLENAYAIAVAMDHAASTDATRNTISALYDHLVDRFGPAVAYETHSRLEEHTRTHIHIDYVDGDEDPFDGQQPEDWEPWEPGQPWAPTEFDDRIG